MPDHAAIDFHDVEYIYSGDVTVEPLTHEGDILVRTVCPACHGRSTTEFRYGLPHGTKGPRVEPARQVVVICSCGYPHNMRPSPSLEYGCGALWKIDLP